jgi:hypothetical protein
MMINGYNVYTEWNIIQFEEKEPSTGVMFCPSTFFIFGVGKLQEVKMLMNV